MAYNCKTTLVLLGLAALSACGGGGGGGIASAPAPATSPSPQPPPASPLPTGPLAATQNFTTVGTVTRSTTALDGSAAQFGSPSMDEPIGFRYSAETQSYGMEAPDFQAGTLIPDTTTGGSRDYNVATGGDASNLQKLRVYLNPEHRDGSGITLTYTGFGVWGALTNETAQTGGTGGIFAYGIPTASADIPKAGSATYTAHIAGSGWISGWRGPISIGGKAQLDFDFGRGSLSGFMDPTLMDDWGPTPLGRYEFADTVHGVGSQTFSGRFVPPGSNAASGFLGRFNGPGASEVMASWFAPFTDPWETGTAWGTMSGIWVGKKD